MNTSEIFQKLWNDYAAIAPSANKVKQLFLSHGESEVANDHIAFRTFDDERVSIDKLSTPFVELGYREVQTYYFKEKKLFAKHFEHSDDERMPKIFISHLLLNECSPFVQEVARAILNEVSWSSIPINNLIFAGRAWSKPSFATYQKLQEESEYAAWLYVHGIRVNHFTVFVNFLSRYKTLVEVNNLLKQNGFMLNAAGGEIKGSEEELLMQSSILADEVAFDFLEGEYPIPTCYYEFAQRFCDSTGKLYSGFIAASANKIFESTDKRLIDSNKK